MIRKVSFAALAVLGCTAANAAADNRIRSMPYDPDKIVQVLGRTGIQSTIQFDGDERIQNVAVGDSSKWQVTPNHGATLLFVKPLAARVRTNMTVVTDRRTYMFDLVAGDKFTTPVYALKFSYPNEKPVETAAKPTLQAQVPAQPTATMVAEKLHFDWNKKGSGKLLPSRVFDDGVSLYLAWDKETPLPAILTLSEDRKEGPVNYRMSGEYIVISPIPANLILRYGKTSATLWPSRRIVPVRPPAVPASRIAASATVQAPPSQSASQPVSPPAVSPRPSAPTARTVRLANMTSLYSDQLTDDAHEH